MGAGLVVACTGQSDGGPVEQTSQNLGFKGPVCPDNIPFCPPPNTLSCVVEDGCNVCSCSGALRPAITLASGLHSPRSLAVDNAYLYWANEGDGTIMKIPTGGGTPVTLASGQDSPFAVAVQYQSLSPTIVGTPLSPAVEVAWTTLGGTVMMEWPTGGHPITIGSQNQPFGVAMDWVNVYWTDYAGGGGAGTVMQAPIRGGAPVTLSSGGQPTGIAVDAAYVYWADESGTVQKVPIGGGTRVTIATGGQTLAGGIAVDAPPIPGGLATYVYWTDEYAGTVMRVPVGGGTPTTLATGQPAPGDLVLDSDNVYWCNTLGGTVMMVPHGGGAVTTLVTGLVEPGGVAVDATNVYYADWSGGIVGYVAK